MQKSSTKNNSSQTTSSKAKINDPKTKPMQFRHQFDPTYNGSPGEYNTQPSQTEPDMSLTVRQLLTNHSRGIQSNVKEYPLNYLETEIPKITDLTDMADFREKNAQKKKEITDEHKRLTALAIAKKTKEELNLAKQQKGPETPPKEAPAD